MKTSESITKLAKAMSLSQPEVKRAIKGKPNKFFKSTYADLTMVWEACAEALHKNGLTVLQPMKILETGGMVVETMLLHESGEWVCGETLVCTEKPGPQGLGSAQTYARRYGLAAMVGVCPEGEDDDAEGATNRTAPKDKSTPKKPSGNAKSKLLDEIIDKFKKLESSKLTPKENKKHKSTISVDCFGVPSWADVKILPIAKLKEGLDLLNSFAEMKDEIPETEDS